ncbi:MAG TPA: discoidin domain-containing protein, partial [Gemmatimonadaceae bacterium]
MKGRAIGLLFCVLTFPVRAQTPPTTSPPANASSIVVDSFDSVTQWTTTPAEGVEISVHPDSNGVHGRAMRVDFDFHGHGGYGVIHRAFNLALPSNYEISFAIKGDAPTNTLELKLIDSTGDNVWWSNNPNFRFPKDWTTVTRKKRQISFAWGPTNNRELRQFAAIEIAITAGSGGKGSIWLDDLVVTPLSPDTRFYPSPLVTSSSQMSGYEAGKTVDADAASGWRSAPVRVSSASVTSPTAGTIASGSESIDLDFQTRREFGGVVITWEPGRRATSYVVQTSPDRQSWQTIYTVRRGSASPFAPTSAASTKTALASSAFYRDYLYLPESDARYMRLVLTNPETSAGYGIRDISIKPFDWAATENDFFLAIARDAPRGSYPRPFVGEQSYWTVVGVDRDSAEALINEEGIIEVGRGQFSIEPFVYNNGKLITWNDAKTSVASNAESLPLPQVVWSANDIDLTITAFAAGGVDSSVLYARYRLTNNSKGYKKLTLYLALRPFQVNPPWQFLNLPGGVAHIDSISQQGVSVRVSGNKFVRALASPSGFGA